MGEIPNYILISSDYGFYMLSELKTKGIVFEVRRLYSWLFSNSHEISESGRYPQIKILTIVYCKVIPVHLTLLT